MGPVSMVVRALSPDPFHIKDSLNFMHGLMQRNRDESLTLTNSINWLAPPNFA